MLLPCYYHHWWRLISWSSVWVATNMFYMWQLSFVSTLCLLPWHYHHWWWLLSWTIVSVLPRLHFPCGNLFLWAHYVCCHAISSTQFAFAMLACDTWMFLDCITWQLIFMWRQGVSCHITCCVVEVVCLFFKCLVFWHGNFEPSTFAACEYMATHFFVMPGMWVALLHAVQWKLCALFWSALCLTWQLEHF